MTDASTRRRRRRNAHSRRRRFRRSVGVGLLIAALSATVGVVAWGDAGADKDPSERRRSAWISDSSVTSWDLAVEPASSVLPVVLAQAPSGPATITIAAVGDMIFDRRVKELVRAEGGLAPLRHVAEALAKADIAVGNLESPLSDGGTKAEEKDVTFRGHPAAIAGLKASGFDFLSLANNHVLDYGPESLGDTIESLDRAGIGHAGAGMDRDAAWEPAVREIGDTTVAFLSFSHILPPGFIATSSKAGLAPGRTDMSAVADAIAEAAEVHDYVLVSFHWGIEYADDANADQVRDARTAIDAGADMVLSHHPHVIQGVEFYGGGLIAYSLGDFVFDHYSRKTGEAFILNASLGPHGVADVTAVPVYLDSYGAPEFVDGSEARVILERLRTISGKHGTSVTLKGDVAVLEP